MALPPLSDLFHIGQLVRCTVAGLRTGAAAGEEAADKAGKQGGKGGKGGSARKRVDLSLRVSKMNAGLGEQGWAVCNALVAPAAAATALCVLLPRCQRSCRAQRQRLACSCMHICCDGCSHFGTGPPRPDCFLCAAPRPSLPTGAESLKDGLALPACVRSVEDHGYLLALGVKARRFCWAVGSCARRYPCRCLHSLTPAGGCSTHGCRLQYGAAQTSSLPLTRCLNSSSPSAGRQRLLAQEGRRGGRPRAGPRHAGGGGCGGRRPAACWRRQQRHCHLQARRGGGGGGQGVGWPEHWCVGGRVPA